jgi:hypothetical protein
VASRESAFSREADIPPRQNPLKLNSLQLRTLAVLQLLARDANAAAKGPGIGEVTVQRFPEPHGGHFHLGNSVVAAKDASGLYNENVWNALERKRLARADWPHRITLTATGLGYDTGAGDTLFQASPH